MNTQDDAITPDRISSWDDFLAFTAADRAGARDGKGATWRIYLTRPTFRFLLALRLTEWICSTTAHRSLKTAARMRLRGYGRSFGFTVPIGVCWPGLRLPHWGSVVVSDQARVGSRVTIHSGVNIGAWAGGAPTVGNDCYLAPGAKLFGPISIGDNCRIGVNAVVDRSWPPGTTLVASRAVPVSLDQETTTAT